jgi:hypothetical protein
MTARAEPIVMRVALIYALLDGSQNIRQEHLLAALEVWRYCDNSARFIFGDNLGNPIADKMLQALREKKPVGMSGTEMSKLLGGHETADTIKAAGELLIVRGKITKRQTPGSKLVVYIAV